MRVQPLLACLALVAVAAGALAQYDHYGELKGLKIDKTEDTEHVKTVPAPKGAIVLFDGKSLDGWVGKGKDKKAEWSLLKDGVMEVKAGKGDIYTSKTFEGKFKLHVE